jgi:hypothetical protein
LNTETICYLLRKTSLTRTEIGKLTPEQFSEIVKEVGFQESVEDYRNQYNVALIASAIYNTIPRRKGSKAVKISDLLQGEMPTRGEKIDTFDDLAETRGVKSPNKELRER